MTRERVRAHVTVAGRVQGVAFRASTQARARELGVAGWVRNLPDGRVEAEFIGTRQQVEEALRFVREGPRFARVDSVEGGELETLEPTDEPGRFEIH